jgi:hypothetical protein
MNHDDAGSSPGRVSGGYDGDCMAGTEVLWWKSGADEASSGGLASNAWMGSAVRIETTSKSSVAGRIPDSSKP